MLKDKLLDYVQYETTSSEESESSPTTATQFDLARHLLSQLEEMGVKEIVLDEYCYVYGYLEGDPEYQTLGLIAHMDTSPQASGKNVKPKMIENYDGKDIVLDNGIVTSVERFPNLKNYIGKTLMVTDGNTLLGADDKAGVAIIMEVLETLISHPEIKHGPVRICFTPDEEVGKGTAHFDYDRFKVDYAYTVDGDEPNNIAYENFNGAASDVEITGILVHPGSAKDIMVNALTVAHEFHDMMDKDAVPEKTQGYEGFNMLEHLSGDVAKAKLHYIIRNHDADKLEKQKHDFEIIRDKLNEKYGYEAVKVEIKDSYRNMKEKFVGHEDIIDLVKKTMANIGLNYKEIAIRGGTDGAVLTWNGILCPNIGTGGQNFHGVHEFWCKEDGEKVVELILEMLKMAKK